VEERENDVECWELEKMVLNVETIVDGLRKRTNQNIIST
jgi:hypothetical protein